MIVGYFQLWPVRKPVPKGARFIGSGGAHRDVHSVLLEVPGDKRTKPVRKSRRRKRG